MTAGRHTDPIPTSFRLRGGLYPLTQLDVHNYDTDQFRHDLERKVAEAPAFFRQTPVVLSFEDFNGDPCALPLKELRQHCLDFGLLPIAVRSQSDALSARALTAGMPALSGGAAKSKPATPAHSDTTPPAEDTPTDTSTHTATSSRVITEPVRSGQQIYAPGGDLIVIAPVSAGAEILADGNIHVYGALRGRALAGVKGNPLARIFCHSLEAELVSIAGNFKLDEDFRESFWKKTVQIRLNEQALEISTL